MRGSLTKNINDCISVLETAIKTDAKNAKPKYNFKYLVVLDFEATCAKDKKKFKPIEVIEWPAIIIDIETLKIYNNKNDYFHEYIKPTYNPILTPFCTELTGIRQKTVDNGIYIEEALDKWNKWCYYNDLLPNNNDPTPRAAIVTCGDWDLNIMWAKQCIVSSFKFNKPAMLFAAWINVKEVFQRIMGLNYKIGMMRMLQILNISHIGKHHSGIDDVKNICNIVVTLLKRNKNIFLDYTKHFHSKDINRSLFDDLYFGNQMDKITGGNRNKNEYKDDIKYDYKEDELHVATVTVPWIESNGIDMKVVMFHSSKKEAFGAQFSCLFYSDISIDTATKIYVPNSNEVTTLMVNPSGKVTFQSAEHIFQCSKAKNIWDDLFMRELTAFECGKCGAGRLHIRSNKMKKLYESHGGTLIKKGSGKTKRWWLSDTGYFPLREYWDDIKIQIMYHALKQKFLQHEYLIKKYLNDDLPIYFIEHVQYEGDNIWADGGGKGKNWLGKLLTVIAWMMKYKMNEFKQQGNDKACVVDLLDKTFLQWMNTPNNNICNFRK
eukprot:481878_1